MLAPICFQRLSTVWEDLPTTPMDWPMALLPQLRPLEAATRTTTAVTVAMAPMAHLAIHTRIPSLTVTAANCTHNSYNNNIIPSLSDQDINTATASADEVWQTRTISAISCLMVLIVRYAEMTCYLFFLLLWITLLVCVNQLNIM